MKRREFLHKTFLVAGALVVSCQTALSQTAKQVSTLISKVKVYAREGVLGFKKEAPLVAVKANKRCENCRWYKLPVPIDPLCPNEGLCTLVGMKSAMKTEEVYVESKSYCNMWQKELVKKV